MPVSVIDAEAVRIRMSLPDLPDVNNVIESALVATHSAFSGMLDTKFDPVANAVDLFQLTSTYWPVIPDAFYRCRLKMAFVKSTGLTVAVSDTRTGTFTALTESDFYVSYEKGVVYVSEETMDGLNYEPVFLKVTYSAGFDATNKPPTWLKEAMLAYVPSVLNTQQATNRSGEAEPMFKQNTKLAALMLEPNLRGLAFHFRPIQ